MTIRKRGSSWQADAKGPDGRRERRSFKTHAEAERWAAQMEKDATLETLGEFFERKKTDLWGSTKHPQVPECNMRVIYRYLPASTPIRDVDAVRIDSLTDAMIAYGLANGTINRKLATLSKLLRKAAKLQVIPSMPEIERRQECGKRDRVWEPADEERAISYLMRHGLTRCAYLCAFLLYTGCRVGEAYKLTQRDVDLVQDRVTFRDTKNGTSRTIKLVPAAKVAWAEMVRLAPGADRPFTQYPRNTFRSHWDRLRQHFDASGDPNFVPHMLRHTCATRLARAPGMTLMAVMKWMGHRSIQTTMRYQHLMVDDLDICADALS